MTRKTLTAAAFTLTALLTLGAAAQQPGPIAVGSRLELLVDDYLIDSMKGAARFELHHPTPRDIVMVHDAPWEGAGSGYHTVFKDGSIYRMYYKAWHLKVDENGLTIPHDTLGCYAESVDGIHWVKPDLGLFEFEGSTANNIVCEGKGSHDFTPFKDTNPDCPPEASYKAVGYGKGGLYGFVSEDAIHWTLVQQDPIMTGYPFDTQNVAFWDSEHGLYRAYVRDFDRDAPGFGGGKRGIRMATSPDFINWTEAEWLIYPDSPPMALYTNQVKPYYRAPHIYVGFPTRYVELDWSPSTKKLPNLQHREWRAKSNRRYGTAITEALLMTSRDGLTFKRWGDPFLAPGLGHPGNWMYGDKYLAWHVVETKNFIKGAPDELSLYATESYWTDNSSALRRYTLRVDGFVSAHAPLEGGELVTKPLVFDGSELVLNFATAAFGGMRIEIQDAQGNPIDGFRLEDCPELFGDSIEWVVPFKDGSDLAALAGTPVRLRFVMKSAGLYGFQFRKSSE